MISRLLTFLSVGFLAAASLTHVNAAVISIELYELTGTVADGDNFFDDYTLIGSGSFAIADVAIGPDALILFNDPNFLFFNLMLTNSHGDSSTFTLLSDDFYDGVTPDPKKSGIVFDVAGEPLRFDYPDSVIADTATVCDPLCDGVAIGGRATLRLRDNDNFDKVYEQDGDITTSALATVPFTPLNGDWAYLKGAGDAGGSGILVSGVYVLQVVPIPLDTDNDGIVDADDNCTLIPNGPAIPDAGGNSQLDSNGDGFGNACDADLNDDLVVNGVDVGPFVQQFGTSGPDADINGDGVVNGLDVGPFVDMFGQAPGPSAQAP